MTSTRTRLTLLLCLGLSLLLAGVLAATSTSSAAPSHRSSPYRKPVASFKVGDPGVIYANGQWVDLATGSWAGTGTISVAPAVQGPWTQVKSPLLTRRPMWASATDTSVWAPSIVQAADGRYVIFYAALVAGQRYARCIGTAHSTSPTGPFEPRGKPIACYNGSHTDSATILRSEGSNFSLIDATPAVIDGAYYLTFKTQFRRPDHRWHTTTRLVQLDPTKPDKTAVSHVRTITSWVSPSIEENPVLVKHRSTYTLFTSRGWYGTCTGRYQYHTVYRQSPDLVHWSQPHTLSFPKGTRTCGTGDAAVAPDGASWTIFFSGHYPREADSFKLYTGHLDWSSGKPYVKAMYSGR